MIEGIGEGLKGWLILTIILAVLAVFGIWKIVEIVIWLFENVTISVV